MEKFDILKKEYRLVYLQGLVMAGAPFLYWVLIQFFIQSSRSSNESITLLRYALYFMAAIHLIAIFFLKKILLQKKPQDALIVLVGKLKRSAMTTLALCEAPALYGLVLYFIGGSRVDFYILVIYSLMLFGAFFPRLSQWEKYTAGAV